jgi:DNA polymerase I-like protein with 3'-5' exonuclease and polymerase domains
MGLSEQGIEVSLGEAKRLHSAYWDLFAQVKKYEKWLKAQWERNGGWWLNPIGRPVCADERKLKDLCNVDCQSGGHDIFLLFTKVLAEELDKRGIVYQPWNYDIHDCTALEIDEGDVDEVREVVDKVVPDKVNALLGGVVRLKWEANFVKCWAEDKTESPSIDELGVKL